MDINILSFLLYGIGVVSCFHTVIYEYHFINNAMTWGDARQYCRRHYTDLATFWSRDDVYRVERPSGYGGVAWIGLFDDPASWRGVMGKDSNSWRWSVTGSTSPGGFQNWATGQPDYAAGTHQCVTIRSGLWYDSPCSSQFRFACFTESGKKTYTPISTPMTWEEARSHCRERYTDLAMIEDNSENTAVASLLQNVTLWIGLYREPWRWSDGSQSTFTNWKSGDPNNMYRKQHCVVEKRDYTWGDQVCFPKRTFICQRVVPATRKSRIVMKLQSAVDLSDPAIHTQIIQQVGAELERMGITDVDLKWKIPPVLPTNQPFPQ